MAYIPKGTRFNRAGIISLYYNGEIVDALRFNSRKQRAGLIKHWDRKYQFDKKEAGTIFLEVVYD